MASHAQDNAAEGKVGKPPISTHRAFPPIVALWFAALLGLGSLVVPVTLIEQLVVMTGVSSIISATAPPLGVTARCLIALAFGGGGALAGLLIARKVAATHRTPAAGTSRRFASTVAASGARRPISALDELGGEGLGDRKPGSRRALALQSEDGPSEFLDFAPLPGISDAAGQDLAESPAAETDDPDAFELTEMALEPELAAPESAAAEPDSPEPYSPEPYSLAPFSPPATPGFTVFDAWADLAGGEDARDDAVTDFGEDNTMTDRQMFIAPPPQDEALDEEIDSAWVEDNEPQEDALAFSPPSLSREDDELAADDHLWAEEDDEEGDDDGEEAEAADHFAADATEYAADGAHEDAPEGDAAAQDDIEQLGMIQLAQRLGASIEKRRAFREARAALAASAAAAAVTTPARAAPADIDAAPADEAAQAMAAYFSRPAADEVVAEVSSHEAEADAPQTEERQVFRPVAEQDDEDDTAMLLNLGGSLGGFAFDYDDDEDASIDDLAASFSLPINLSSAITAQAARGADADTLTGPINPFANRAEEFVRIEDEPTQDDGAIEPAVVFPSNAGTGDVVTLDAAAPRAFDPPSGMTGTAPSRGAARLDSEENEKVLREALLNLKRMSGTA